MADTLMAILLTALLIAGGLVLGLLVLTFLIYSFAILLVWLAWVCACLVAGLLWPRRPARAPGY